MFLIPATLQGGEMYISSPGGYLYPRAVSWDISASELELALEWTYDVGEVTVSYSEDANTTRNYRVTFEVGDALRDETSTILSIDTEAIDCVCYQHLFGLQSTREMFHFQCTNIGGGGNPDNSWRIHCH